MPPRIFHCHSLGIGLLQQGAPKLSRSGWATKQQHSVITDRQTVINNYICPSAKAPESEMEDACIQVWVLWVPLLIHMVGYHLGEGEGNKKKTGKEEGKKDERKQLDSRWKRSKGGSNTNTQPSSTEMAQMLGRKWRPPSSSYLNCLGVSHECWCRQQTNEGLYISPGGKLGERERLSLSQNTRKT